MYDGLIRCASATYCTDTQAASDFDDAVIDPIDIDVRRVCTKETIAL